MRTLRDAIGGYQGNRNCAMESLKGKSSQYTKYQSTDEVQSVADNEEKDGESPCENTKSSSMHDMVKHLQKQAEEVGKVMKDNMTKVLERHDRLVELEDRSQSLEESVSGWPVFALFSSSEFISFFSPDIYRLLILKIRSLLFMEPIILSCNVTIVDAVFLEMKKMAVQKIQKNIYRKIFLNIF